jgi:hypothetical protein
MIVNPSRIDGGGMFVPDRWELTRAGVRNRLYDTAEPERSLGMDVRPVATLYIDQPAMDQSEIRIEVPRKEKKEKVEKKRKGAARAEVVYHDDAEERKREEEVGKLLKELDEEAAAIEKRGEVPAFFHSASMRLFLESEPRPIRLSLTIAPSHSKCADSIPLSSCARSTTTSRL